MPREEPVSVEDAAAVDQCEQAETATVSITLTMAIAAPALRLKKPLIW